MAEPVFTNEDRVATGGLPPELVGKSPAEVASFYQNRENQILERARQAISNATTQQPPPPSKSQSVQITKEDWYNDPNKAAEMLVAQKGVGREEFQQIAGPVQRTLIRTAKMLASQGKDNWSRFESEIDRIMSSLNEWQRTDPEMWETAYYNVVGLNMKTLTNEASTNARTTAEAPSPPPETPQPPMVLTPTQEKICERLGIKQDTYREAVKRMEDGVWPLTMSNQAR
jgi:hypothetical protein